MKFPTIVFLLICTTVFSRKGTEKALINGTWILTSGQTRAITFSADTLSFVNSLNYEFYDSIHRKPNIAFLPIWGQYFGFCFKTVIDRASRSCIETQYGYWKFDRKKEILSLQLLEPDGATDNFEKWKKLQKVSYSIIKLTADRLILVRKQT